LEAKIVIAEDWHLCCVAADCRQSDREELHAMAGVDPYTAIQMGRDGGDTWAGLIDGVPVCVFGVVPVGGMHIDMGRPWMVATEGIEKNAIAFLRRNKNWIRGMMGRYHHLINYVDARNTKAVQWLRWLGFQIHEAEPCGTYGLPFHKFEMRG